MEQFGVTSIHKTSSNVFSIIEEYAGMSPRAKDMLSDQLYVEGHDAFYQTVEMMWPQSTHRDAIKLEKFIIILRKATRRLLH